MQRRRASEDSGLNLVDHSKNDDYDSKNSLEMISRSGTDAGIVESMRDDTGKFHSDDENEGKNSLDVISRKETDDEHAGLMKSTGDDTLRASTRRKHRRPKLNTDRPCATILWLRDFLVMILGLPFRGAPLLIGELISDFSATTTIRCVAFMLIVLALCSFEVLCVIDGQCLNSNANPAVLEASSRWTLVIVVLLLLTAAFMVSFTVKSSGARAKMLSKDTENSIDMSSWDCHAFVIITSLLMVAAMGIVLVLFMIEISSQSEVERKRVKGQWDGGKYSWKVESYYGNAARLEEQILVLARSLLSFAFLSFALLFLLAGALSSQLLRKSGPI